HVGWYCDVGTHSGVSKGWHLESERSLAYHGGMPVNKASAVATTRRPRRSSAEVRARILSAAVALFAERGYRDATTREIAHRGEGAEPVIFRIYPTKQALFDAAVLEPFDEFLSEYTARWLAAPTPGGSPEEVLQQFVEELHDLVRQNRQLVAAL